MSMAAPLYYTADMVRALPDDGNLEHEVLTWHPEGASEAFSLPLSELFRPL